MGHDTPGTTFKNVKLILIPPRNCNFRVFCTINAIFPQNCAAIILKDGSTTYHFVR